MESGKEPVNIQLLNFVVTLEEQSGWNPSRSDINRLIHDIKYPSRRNREEMIEFSREMDKSYREHK